MTKQMFDLKPAQYKCLCASNSEAIPDFSTGETNLCTKMSKSGTKVCQALGPGVHSLNKVWTLPLEEVW